MGSLPPNMWNITLLWLFYCPVLSWLYFFSQTRAKVAPLAYMTRRHPSMCLLGVWMTTGSNPKTPKRAAWLGIFQPNWQNYKIAISPAGKIRSSPNFQRVIEPHSWLRGWSKIAKFQFKMADGLFYQLRAGRVHDWKVSCTYLSGPPYCKNVGNAITRLPMDRFRWSLGGRIPSCPQYVRHDAVSMAIAVA